MTDVEKRGSDQLAMWDGWHSQNVAADGSQLHFACRGALLDALPSLADSGPILELGCGQGFDATAIAKAGYSVEALDFSNVALEIARRRLAMCDGLPINYVQRDISLPLPYSDSTFSGIFSYLAIHYFDTSITRNIFNEIARVASRGCVLSAGVRSVEDPLFGKGEQLDRHFFDCDGHVRHFFSPAEVADLLNDAWTIRELQALRAFYLSDAEPLGGIIKILAIRN